MIYEAHGVRSTRRVIHRILWSAGATVAKYASRVAGPGLACGMKSTRTWQGVRMRRVTVGADPDAPPRLVTLRRLLDDAAAAALAALVPDEKPVMLAAAADAWIRPIAERALRAGMEMPLSERLHRMLLLRHGSPSLPIWQGQNAAVPGFVLNLASFHDAAAGFDTPAFVEAVETAVTALTLAAPAAPRLAVGVTDLAGLLALLGVEYGSDASLAIARAIAAIVRGRAEAASGALARLFGNVAPAGLGWPAAPDKHAGARTGGSSACLASGRRGCRKPPAHRADGGGGTRPRRCVARRGDRRHRASLFAARRDRRPQPDRPSLASGKWHNRRGRARGGACRRRSDSHRERRRPRRDARRGGAVRSCHAGAAGACYRIPRMARAGGSCRREGPAIPRRP